MQASKIYQAHGDSLYVIAHGPNVHAVEITPGGQLTTGQEKVETFEDEDSWRKQLDQHGYEWPSEDDEAEGS